MGRTSSTTRTLSYTSKLGWRTPHYKPEIAAQCTLINFIVTQSGLEDQLLAKVVGRERADEQQKNELVQASPCHKIQLKGLEDDLLYKLANAPADILSTFP